MRAKGGACGLHRGAFRVWPFMLRSSSASAVARLAATGTMDALRPVWAAPEILRAAAEGRVRAATEGSR
ncbi:hypothetical protein [Amycolatopsis sp. TNS106]|uniref:hypothetical protein n=1 Tax=Amycolatopsis sp. TNS106 TaxID=2861750 RepID=UPI001C56EEC6|nr:hypothetical protein [Amycolatopsis sp. TNS106]QXV57806.1 hypothetical protein CVV72_12935 [Amycolatopsis sp. TNS106]